VNASPDGLGGPDVLLLEAAFEQAPIGMGVVDTQGRYRRVNRSLCHLLGRHRAELLMRDYRDFFHPDDVAAERRQWEELLRGAIQAYQSENRRVRPDGSLVWIHDFVSAVPGRPGKPRLVIRQVVDVTVQRGLTSALEKARRAAIAAAGEAERAGRTALEASGAKTEFLSRVSHELRTPLTAMLGFAELMEGDALSEPQVGRLGHIAVAGRHLLGLVNELLDLARIEQGRFELSVRPVAVADVLAEVETLIRSDATAAGLDFPPVRAPRNLAVVADRGRLVEILLNLLSNAVKFSPAGGTVGVSAQAAENRVAITVTDRGPGLTSEERSRLFVPFERLGAEQRGVPGTGLGLAVSRRLAEAMGGDLTVASQPGRGSSFTVSLPAADLGDVTGDATGPSSVWSEERHAVLRSRRWSVLYVEDDPANARLVDAILARFCDVSLAVAPTGKEGLDWAARGAFDLVLLDLSLPDMRGNEVLQRLRAEPDTAGLPVVILTADATAARGRELLLAGAQGFQGKPITVRSLLDTLADVLAAAPPAAP
jgi:PAS domain S-box-containing protein